MEAHSDSPVNTIIANRNKRLCPSKTFPLQSIGNSAILVTQSMLDSCNNPSLPIQAFVCSVLIVIAVLLMVEFLSLVLQIEQVSLQQSKEKKEKKTMILEPASGPCQSERGKIFHHPKAIVKTQSS